MRRWHWLVSAVVIALLAFSARQVHWAAAADAISDASLALLLLALALNGASIGLRAMRWLVFLRAAGIGSLSTALRGVIVACGFNNLVVANAGEAARTLLVTRTTDAPAASVLATIALDRLFDPICFGLLLLVGTLTVPLPASLSATLGTLAVLGAGVFLALLLMASRQVHPAPGKAWRHQLSVLRGCILRLSTARRFAIGLSLSIGVWLLQIAEYAVVARSLGVPLPFGASVAAMIVINAGLLVRATPGGLGYFEFAYALAVSHFGVATDIGVAIALVIQMIEIIPVTLAAVVITATFHTERATRRKDLVFSVRRWLLERDSRSFVAPQGDKEQYLFQ